MNANDPRHGTSAGYDAHRYDGEEACTACRDGAAAYEYRRRIDSILGHTYTTTSLGTARRIQALVALGWTFGQISERLGRAHDYARKLAFQTDTFVRTSTAERVAGVYDEMSMSLPPSETGRDKHRIGYARRTASRYGWVPPLAWDDIDGDEKPHGARNDKRPDPVVIDRILAGDFTLARTANRAERVEIVRRWRANGQALNELARATGWEPRRYLTTNKEAA